MILKIKSEILGKVVIFLYCNDTVEMKKNTVSLQNTLQMYPSASLSYTHTLALDLCPLALFICGFFLVIVTSLLRGECEQPAPWPWIHTLFCALVDKTRSSALFKFLL